MSLSQSRAVPTRRPGAPPSRKATAKRKRPPGIRSIRPPRAVLDRRTALPRVLALWPQEIDDVSVAGRQIALAKLKRALRAERRRGIAGHWTYDLARHVELLHLYRQELALLNADRQRARSDRADYRGNQAAWRAQAG